MTERAVGETPATRLELADRARWGASEHAVKIRLIGATEADVQLQIDRMVLVLGVDFIATAPKRGRRGSEWVAHGLIVS